MKPPRVGAKVLHGKTLVDALMHMVHVEPLTAVYSKLENRPGSLERLSKVLAERRVNIDSIALETVGSTGFVRLLALRPKEAVEALRSAQLEAYESQFLLVGLHNRPGELARASAELAAAKINVESCITTHDGKVALRTSDNEHAAQILRKL